MPLYMILSCFSNGAEIDAVFDLIRQLESSNYVVITVDFKPDFAFRHKSLVLLSLNHYL